MPRPKDSKESAGRRSSGPSLERRRFLQQGAIAGAAIVGAPAAAAQAETHVGQGLLAPPTSRVQQDPAYQMTNAAETTASTPGSAGGEIRSNATSAESTLGGGRNTVRETGWKPVRRAWRRTSTDTAP